MVWCRQYAHSPDRLGAHIGLVNGFFTTHATFVRCLPRSRRFFGITTDTEPLDHLPLIFGAGATGSLLLAASTSFRGIAGRCTRLEHSTIFKFASKVVRSMDVVDSWQAAQCVKGCGFFGAPWTAGMCSKCYMERDRKPLPLLVDPLPDVSGKVPLMLWSQRAASVCIKVALASRSEFAAGFSDASRLSLQARSQDMWYEVKAMPLFASCIPARSSVMEADLVVTLVLAKQKRKWWDRLCTDETFRTYIKPDLGSWREEDDEDYEEPDGIMQTESADGAARANEDEPDDSDPRFGLWQWLQRTEASVTDRPLSKVFDAIDGFHEKEEDAAAPPPIRPEFTAAASAVCLAPHWLSQTRMLRHLAEMDRILREDPSMGTRLADAAYFDELAAAVVQRAYRLGSAEAARNQPTVVPQDEEGFMEIPPSLTRPFRVLQELRETVSDSGKVKLAYALQLLLEYEKPDGLVAKLHEVSDRVPRCNAAKKQAFNMLFTCAFRCKERGEPAARNGVPVVPQGVPGEEQLALDHVRYCFGDFLDDHKERALNSAFIEPSRLYFHAVGDKMSFELVTQHGINWYLVLLHAGLGMTLPFLPDYNDLFEHGTADFWLGLSRDAWEAFADPANLGKEFHGIRAFKEVGFGSGRFVQDDSVVAEFPRGVQTRYPRNLARIIADTESGRCAAVRRKLAVYLVRFAHFFSRDVFLRKSFETLISETKPEHAGFRKSLARVYEIFKGEAEEEFPSASVEGYCYRDEYFMDLDLDRTEKLFAWLGFVKPPAVPEMCPICCEEKLDVEMLSHWQAVGDVSSHKMCAGCREAYGKNECPFCKEVLLKDEFLGFIAEFTKNVHRNSAEQQDARSMQEYVAAANRSAQLLEHWQLFEMQHDGNARLVCRVAKLVVDELAAELQGAVASRSCDFLRDIAGVVFRLHALIKAGEVKASADQAQVFADAVECIFNPFERPVPLDYHCGPFEGHFYGNLYNQALVAWLCAYRSGAADTVLRECVRRVGRGIVRCARWYEDRGEKQGLRDFAAEVMHREYILLSHVPCWGSENDDEVWQTFCRTDDRRP